jgi:hypothetical protein
MIVKSFFGLTETAVLPVKRMSQIQVIEGTNQQHFATKSGKLLLSIDTVDRSVHFADPSIVIEHRFEGRVQRFRGNYISLIPLDETLDIGSKD